MLELFIELTNQIFWEGYAEKLSTENPKEFQSGFKEFAEAYNPPHMPAKPRQINTIYTLSVQ